MNSTKIFFNLIQNKSDQQIENALKCKKINWNKILELTSYHNLSSQIYPKIKKYREYVPNNIQQLFKNKFHYTIQKNLIFWQEFLELNILFKKNNIPILPLKGIALIAEFYPNLFAREMLDIDLFIKKIDLEKATNLLCNNGYKMELFKCKENYWKKKNIHLSFHKKTKRGFNILLELHWEYGLENKINSIISKKLWEHKRNKKIENTKIQLPAIEDTIIILILHLRRFGNIFSLKQVKDITNILNTKKYSINWKYVFQTCKKNNMQNSLYFCLKQLSFFPSIKIPKNIIKQINMPKWKQKLINLTIKKNTIHPISLSKLKWTFLTAHFLLHDSIFKTFKYLVFIPYEQFCKFYNLKLYNFRSAFLYKFRFLFIPLNLIYKLLKKIFILENTISI